MPTRFKRRPRPLRYLGLLLLGGLIWYADPLELGRVLAGVTPGWLVLAWALNFPQLGLKVLRWQTIVRWQGLALGYGHAFLAYFSALLVGFITPGRLGEMTKAFTLKHEFGANLAHAMSSVVLDRMFDMYLLLTLGGLGILRFALVGDRISWPVFGGLCVLLVIPLLLLHPRVVRGIGRATGRLPGLAPRAALIEEKVGRFADGLAVMRPVRLLVCVVLTASAYALFFFQCLLCAFALGFTVAFRDLVLMMAATNFISFMPISPSGLGTREACLTFFLGQTVPPHPPEIAVAFGLVVFLVFFVGGGLIGFVCWQLAPIDLKRAVHDVRAAAGHPPGPAHPAQRPNTNPGESGWHGPA